MSEVDNGCDLCGDFPAVLVAKCHPGAPLRAEMVEPNLVVLKCYLPDCNREVARLKVSGEKAINQQSEKYEDAKS